MRQRLLTGLLSAAALCPAFAAEPLTLKCVVKSPGDSYDLWLVIDTQNNKMRVDGTANELSVTNERYSSRSARVAGFVTVYSMDRQTGELTITEL